jgi:hypothetical protein
VNIDFEFHDFQPPVIIQCFLQMRNNDLACQGRMVVRHVCLRVFRSVLKLNFKPIPKILGADLVGVIGSGVARGASTRMILSAPKRRSC